MIIPADAQKAFAKVQHPIMIKTPSCLNIESFLHLIKRIYKTFIANIQLTGEKPAADPRPSGTRRERAFSQARK